MVSGRITLYTNELAKNICEQLMQGLTLVKICKQEGMPQYNTICNWLATMPVFLDMYLNARRVQLTHRVDVMYDEIDDINQYKDQQGNIRIDAAAVALKSLKINTLKWEASKLLKVFADKKEDEKEDKIINVILNKGNLNE
jgi:hypothetical protein